MQEKSHRVLGHLCKTNVEDVIHIISGCPFMSARYYLPMRHDMGAKTLHKEIFNKNHPEIEAPKEINEQEYIQKLRDKEYWWNLSINTVQKVQHNKPDLVIWNTTEILLKLVVLLILTSLRKKRKNCQLMYH